jgi:hypothetical protein
LITSCFLVTYLLPDAIFQFIGAQSSATSQTGRHETDHARDGGLTGAGISRTVQTGLDHAGAAGRKQKAAGQEKKAAGAMNTANASMARGAQIIGQNKQSEMAGRGGGGSLVKNLFGKKDSGFKKSGPSNGKG